MPSYYSVYSDFRQGLVEESRLKAFDMSLLPQDIRNWTRYFYECDLKKAKNYNEIFPLAVIKESGDVIICRHSTMFINGMRKGALTMQKLDIYNVLR